MLTIYFGLRTDEGTEVGGEAQGYPITMLLSAAHIVCITHTRGQTAVSVTWCFAALSDFPAIENEANLPGSRALSQPFLARDAKHDESGFYLLQAPYPERHSRRAQHVGGASRRNPMGEACKLRVSLRMPLGRLCARVARSCMDTPSPFAAPKIPPIPCNLL
ncbi:hypothetical protein BS50DRAFT_261185 [Corynespora cassiicola Philippines]|uniref:Uncharacterized protein n=1 Tax=Corynespora cassiicola Philippines TaxID=1448308 RepID=A0A2T2N1D3_CORCC|nr:hypothetical protein BS50DRAFT_261185 [Corynespora cassiicola Philippines]